jgi:hypothetical protein
MKSGVSAKSKFMAGSHTIYTIDIARQSGQEEVVGQYLENDVFDYNQYFHMEFLADVAKCHGHGALTAKLSASECGPTLLPFVSRKIC